MLSSEKFNTDNLINIKTIPKSFKVIVFVYSVICIPVSFLSGLLGLLRNGFTYWAITIGLLILFIGALLWTLVRVYIAYQMDIKHQVKLKGTITVTGKSTKKGERRIFTDSAYLKKFQVHLNSVFDEIDIGDKLTIEISKYSKHLLLLEKDGRSLIDAH